MKAHKYLYFFLATIVTLSACRNQDTSVSTELAVPVSVIDLKPGSIEQFINTTGTLVATKSVTVNSEISAHYHLRNNPRTGRPFALGDVVEANQVIIDLKDVEFENQIAIESKKLNLEISEQEYQKQESLYEKGGVTLRELRNAEVSFMNARYDYENALLQLEKMKVKAPFRGVITELPFYTQGIKITSGLPVFTLMDYSKMLMEVNLPEKHINEINRGKTVRIMNYTLPNDTLYGTVNEVSPAISTETRTFKGMLLIENPDLKLRPGMFAKADIITARKDSVIVIPKNVVISGQRGRSVFIVDQGTAIEKMITFGYENQDMAEITSGLEVNNRLVIKGFETLRNRSRVRIIQ